MMFLQLVAGGHLLLFVTRSERWFWTSPYPALPLLGAILATQAVAVAMCGFGWLMPAISWQLIALVWVYNLVWMVVLGGVRSPPSGSTPTASRGRPQRRDRRETARSRLRPPDSEDRAMDYRKKLIVEPGSKFRS